MNALFNWLPLAALVEYRTMCMHGGMPSACTQGWRLPRLCDKQDANALLVHVLLAAPLKDLWCAHVHCPHIPA